MSRINPAKLIVVVCLLFVAGLIIALFATAKTPIGQRISDINDLGGDFELMAARGPVALSDFQGKIVVMYFGYMSCSAVCPTSMRTISASLKRLEPEQASKVQALLVSIDPERDSVDDLADYTSLFHPQLLGVTGPLEQVQAVGRQYGAYFEEPGLSYEDYLLDHVSRYYIIDRNGRLIEAMRHGTTVNELSARLQQLI